MPKQLLLQRTDRIWILQTLLEILHEPPDALRAANRLDARLQAFWAPVDRHGFFERVEEVDVPLVVVVVPFQ